MRKFVKLNEANFVRNDINVNDYGLVKGDAIYVNTDAIVKIEENEDYDNVVDILTNLPYEVEYYYTRDEDQSPVLNRTENYMLKLHVFGKLEDVINCLNKNADNA